MIKTVGYIRYDTEDIIGVCPVCRGDFVDTPELALDLDLTENELLDFEIGFWTIAYCPVCGFIKIIVPPEVE